MPCGLRIASRCQKPLFAEGEAKRQGRGPLSLALVLLRLRRSQRRSPFWPFWLRLRRSPRVQIGFPEGEPVGTSWRSRPCGFGFVERIASRCQFAPLQPFAKGELTSRSDAKRPLAMQRGESKPEKFSIL